MKIKKKMIIKKMRKNKMRTKIKKIKKKKRKKKKKKKKKRKKKKSLMKEVFFPQKGPNNLYQFILVELWTHQKQMNILIMIQQKAKQEVVIQVIHAL